MVTRARFVPVCRLCDLSTERCHLVPVEGREIGVLLHAGRPVALLNECPHFRGPLAEGGVHPGRGEIICPWHRFRFSLATGASVTNPAVRAAFLPADTDGETVRVDVAALAGEAE